MPTLSTPEILSLEPGTLDDHLVWIDDGLEPESIVDAWSTRLDPGDRLAWHVAGERLSIEFNGRVTPVPLEDNRGDVYVTINSLHEAMLGSYDVYLYSPSIDQTTHAFLVGSKRSFQGLDKGQAKALRRHFEPLQPGKDYFSGALTGWPDGDPSEAELEQIHEELFAGLAPETKTGNPGIFDKLDTVPHRDRQAGAKSVLLFFLVLVALLILAFVFLER